MIVKMSKVEVVGPRDRLLAVLDTIRDTHTLEIDPGIQQRMPEGDEARLEPMTLDSAAMAERLVDEDLAARIDRLLALLPDVPSTAAHLHGASAFHSISRLVDTHLATCRDRAARREETRTELVGLRRTQQVLATIDALTPKGDAAAGLDVVAIAVPDPAAIDQLTRHAAKLQLGSEVKVARADDGTYIGLLTTERSMAAALRESLRTEQIPQGAVPPYLEGLSLPQQLAAVRSRMAAAESQLREIDQELRDFAAKWRAVYERTRRWLQDRLTVIKATALIYGTDNCFVVFGWLPSADLPRLGRALEDRFGDAVVVTEKAILETDLESVPVMVRNPRYLQPFELFTRLLPLPRYTSIDPTPFVAIFFPIFFGMIVGDAGYGAVLLAAAAALIAVKPTPLRRQIGQILAVCAVYSVLFGVLYGECFGTAARDWLLVEPCIDRHASFLPMLYFAIAVGSAHVLVGLVLGIVVAMKGRQPREAATRLLTMVALVCVLGLIATLLAPVGELFRLPLLIAMAIVSPLLLIVGGLLAPFELVRHLGNIISYARLMAVGLASVLLAYVANALAGEAGSVWVGITAAVLLHAFNIVLGVFAPTVHALRLHYVEFFSKFFETGGRPYRPLKEVK
jgi:V/A-type H+-transporting ATPase subunit I